MRIEIIDIDTNHLKFNFIIRYNTKNIFKLFELNNTLGRKTKHLNSKSFCFGLLSYQKSEGAKIKSLFRVYSGLVDELYSIHWESDDRIRHEKWFTYIPKYFINIQILGKTFMLYKGDSNLKRKE